MDKKIIKNLLKLDFNELKKTLDLDIPQEDLSPEADIMKIYDYYKQQYINYRKLQGQNGQFAVKSCKYYIFISIVMMSRQKKSQLANLIELKKFTKKSIIDNTISSTFEYLIDNIILKDSICHENIKKTIELCQTYTHKLLSIDIDDKKQYVWKQNKKQIGGFILKYIIQICEVVYLYMLTLFDVTTMEYLPQKLIEEINKIINQSQADSYLETCLQIRYRQLMNTLQSDQTVKTYLFISFQRINFYYERARYDKCLEKIDDFLQLVNPTMLQKYSERTQLLNDVYKLRQKLLIWRQKCINGGESGLEVRKRVESVISRRLSTLIYENLFLDQQLLYKNPIFQQQMIPLDGQSLTNTQKNIQNESSEDIKTDTNSSLSSMEQFSQKIINEINLIQQNKISFDNEKQYSKYGFFLEGRSSNSSFPRKSLEQIANPMESSKVLPFDSNQQINSQKNLISLNQQTINSSYKIQNQFNLANSMVIQEFEGEDNSNMYSSGLVFSKKQFENHDDIQGKISQQIQNSSKIGLQRNIFQSEVAIANPMDISLKQKESIQSKKDISLSQKQISQNLISKQQLNKPSNTNFINKWFVDGQFKFQKNSNNQSLNRRESQENSKDQILMRIKELSKERVNSQPHSNNKQQIQTRKISHHTFETQTNLKQNTENNLKQKQALQETNNYNLQNKIQQRKKSHNQKFQKYLNSAADLTPYASPQQKKIVNNADPFKHQNLQGKMVAKEIGNFFSEMKVTLNQIGMEDKTAESIGLLQTTAEQIDTVIEDENNTKNSTNLSQITSYSPFSTSLLKRTPNLTNQSQQNIQIMPSHRRVETCTAALGQNPQLQFYNTNQILLNISTLNSPESNANFDEKPSYNNSQLGSPILLSRETPKNNSLLNNPDTSKSRIKSLFAESTKNKNTNHYFYNFKNHNNFSSAVDSIQKQQQNIKRLQSAGTPIISKSNQIENSLVQEDATQKNSSNVQLSQQALQDQMHVQSHYLQNAYQMKNTEKSTLNDKPNIINLILKSTLDISLNPQSNNYQLNISKLEQSQEENNDSNVERTINITRQREKSISVMKQLHFQLNEQKRIQKEKEEEEERQRIMKIQHQVINNLRNKRNIKYKKLIEHESLSAEEKVFQIFQDELERLKNLKNSQQLPICEQKVPWILKMQQCIKTEKTEVDIWQSHEIIKSFLKKKAKSLSYPKSIFFRQKITQVTKFFVKKQSGIMNKFKSSEKNNVKIKKFVNSSDSSSNSDNLADDLKLEGKAANIVQTKRGTIQLNIESRLFKFLYSAVLIIVFIKKLKKKLYDETKKFLRRRKSVGRNMKYYLNRQESILSEDSIVYESYIDKFEKQNDTQKNQVGQNLQQRNSMDMDLNNFEFKDLFLSSDANIYFLKTLMNIRRFVNKLFYQMSGYNYPSHDFSNSKIYPPFKFYYRNITWRVQFKVYPQEQLIISASKYAY